MRGNPFATLVATVAVLVAGASLSGFAWMYAKVRAYERATGTSVFSATGSVARAAAPASAATPASSPATNASESAKATPPAALGHEPEAAVAMKVASVEYDGDSKLKVRFTASPELDGIRQYVRVEPLNGGFAGIAYAPKSEGRVLLVTGDFARRTNVVLRIRRGLSAAGGGTCLEEDFTYSFRRRDIPPRVDFAAKGRYLPPAGRRAIAIESVNAPSVRAEVRRVRADAVVQLLAREEGRYRRYYGGGGDSEDTLEISSSPTVSEHRCENVPNVSETWQLPVAVGGSQPQKGVFLVSVGRGDIPFREDAWEYVDGRWCENTELLNPPRFRLVCLSDLGLSVRRCGDRVWVWTTSLTSGLPAGGARVKVLSQTGEIVMEGLSDSTGLCSPERKAPGEPFAVVVEAADGGDMTFMALSDRTTVDETCRDGSRPEYLKAGECTAFVWTDRGIYRHGEKIFFHAILRNGEMAAPKPFPVVVELLNPRGDVFKRETVMSDGLGAVSSEAFSVPAGLPSGGWTVRARMPGDNGEALGKKGVVIEEFAPPQIRVSVAADESSRPSGFSFDVSAEHLFGGPAKSLKCEGAVVFEDAPFAPEGWPGYRFGNEDIGLKPCFRTLSAQNLDDSGKTRFIAAIPADAGKPKAMVRATGQGVVFEDGGRPATARRTVLLHHYPYYIGSTLPDFLPMPHAGSPKVRIACVMPDGTRAEGEKALKVRIERIDQVYSARSDENGWNVWDCERIRSLMADDVDVSTGRDGCCEIELPISECGDYAITVRDPATDVSFARAFYLGGIDDDEVRAPLSDPAAIAIATDKKFYRVGEAPRLVVKAPFAGYALVGAFKDGLRSFRVLNFTNATSEVVLDPVRREDAPNLDVFVSVVQGAKRVGSFMVARAHGRATVPVRPADLEIPVGVSPSVSISATGEGPKVVADISAPGAEVAVVTLVDEGIHMLTGEPEPDTLSRFFRLRGAERPLYDIFGRILPILDGGPGKRGVKIGGGSGEDLLGRVSPVGSRRFRPLSMWRKGVPVVNGRAKAVFDLPEFVGEIRVSAVAYGKAATGAASARAKVAPKLVMMPDAPRFVAPGDEFEVSLPLRNTGDAAGRVSFEVSPRGHGSSLVRGVAEIAAGALSNVVVRLKAPDAEGNLAIDYRAEGLGEIHSQTIEVPVRPAVAWVEACGVCPEDEWKEPSGGKWTAKTFDSPIGGYEAALRWLAEYPHGCLEQTASRIYPLVAAGGLLRSVVTNGEDFISAGVRRVESMVRESDFVMWPDCSTAPWNREVSVYAADFLFAAERSGVKLAPSARERVLKFLKRWARSSDSGVSSYAALVLAQAGVPDRDRMFRLYDSRASLPAISRARLSLAFSKTGDRGRATALLAESFEPQSVKEAAFQMLALLAVNPGDPRVLPLLAWLDSRRDRTKASWGTTEENAHALLAIGAYYSANPPKKGAKFVSWRTLSLPRPSEVVDESEGIFISKRLLDANLAPVDLNGLKCGDLVMTELAITSSVTRTISDLVVEDLFAGAFEPVHRELSCAGGPDWVMRKDAADDRMLIFSKKFTLEAGHGVKVLYPVRVVSAGDYILPGASVEAMYNPLLHSRRAPGRIVVRR